MGLLRFKDLQGGEWEVWEVGARAPLADRAAPASYRGPEQWLCFASGTERRRLRRYPPAWEALSPRELDALCRAADPARGVPAFPPRHPPPEREAP
jgi:hypothetical protein